MTPSSKNTFENGFFWNNYKSIESDFLRFLEYAPYYKSNLKMYSPKLTGFLLQTGGYIDSAFKEMANYFRFKTYKLKKVKKKIVTKRIKKEDTITNVVDAFCILEILYSLSTNNGGHLIAKLDFGDKELYPFKDFSSSQFISPTWWSAYNEVKHEYSLHYRKASLNNVLEALAGAFLLNVTHYPSIKLLWQLGYLKTGGKAGEGFTEMNLEERFLDLYIQGAVPDLKPLNIGIRVETPLYIYMHE
ncbi:MAG: hypothetical protein A2W22_06770 [Candidatus Levybacteria bacterium RBG_16_35_11]|nr:MAG: hypothetical protein A2W22_06770 [Candidatus Levybacteria bacterium RBG_16_35_11]